MYHRIGRVAAEDSAVLPHQFNRQMELLTELGYQIIELVDLVSAMKNGKPLPIRSAVITFDDGFNETCNEACPTLKKHGFPATFFLIGNLLGQCADWLAHRQRLVSLAGARLLVHEGFTVGSHSMTHCRLTELSDSAAWEEITYSKQRLEDGLGVAVRSFAYPFGYWSLKLRDLVASSGYQAACTTQSGFNGYQSDVFALRRIDIDGSYSLSKFKRSLTFGENRMSVASQLLYYSRRFLRSVQIGSVRCN